MDSELEDLYGSLRGFNFNDRGRPMLSSQNFFDSVKLEGLNLSPTYVNLPLLFPISNCGGAVSSLGDNIRSNQNDDYDFSDVILKYISQVLMEEDVDVKTCTYHLPSALEATEKSLYEAIGRDYPPVEDNERKGSPETEVSSPDDNDVEEFVSYGSNGGSNGSSIYHGAYSRVEVDKLKPQSSVGDPSSKPPLLSSYSSYNCSGRVFDFSPSESLTPSSYGSGITDLFAHSPVSALRVSDIFNDSESMSQFMKGVEEANKFLPHGPSYIGPTRSLADKARDNVPVKSGNHLANQYSADALRGRKHRQLEDLCLEEGRGNKQSAVSTESVVRSEMFDKVLLCSKGQNEAALRASWKTSMKNSSEDDQSRTSNGGKGRGKRRGRKKDVVDLRSLLSLCAQAVGSNDHRSANDLLRQIRQHSSPSGDGNQRMAHYFADGLEARLAGVGTKTYSFVIDGPSCAADKLRAYHLFLTACPFKKLSNFFANRTIMNVSEKAKTIHIVDFGILYGFQWPCLIQRLSSIPGGPPKLRITGIDLPQPGFRPAKRVEETGRRLANYAESFNVPFEFNPIAKKWETVTEEDLKLQDDEVLIVNCLYRFKYLHDETVMVESPRNMVLKLIRKIKPEVFTLGVVNGAYNAPFFITRFREALFHFSTLFDMLEATVPRDVEERMLLERELFGRQAMNAIACEGFERIERPETYKQWHVRNERAGFKPLPLNLEIVDMAKERVAAVYHRDFVIDEDGQWLLQGWKGRIVYGISCWKPLPSK